MKPIYTKSVAKHPQVRSFTTPCNPRSLQKSQSILKLLQKLTDGKMIVDRYFSHKNIIEIILTMIEITMQVSNQVALIHHRIPVGYTRDTTNIHQVGQIIV